MKLIIRLFAFFTAVIMLAACASRGTPQIRGFYPSVGVTSSLRQGTSLEVLGRHGRLQKHGSDGYYLSLGAYASNDVFYLDAGFAGQGWVVWDGHPTDVPLAISLGAGPRFALNQKPEGGFLYRGFQISGVGLFPLLMYRIVQDVSSDGRRLWFGELGLKAWFP